MFAKENVISTFGVLAACITGVIIDFEAEGGDVLAVQAMIDATGISVGGLLSFIVFNMTTIPCFAAVATAKAELRKGTFKWTLLFWIVASFIAATVVYLAWDYTWTLAIIIPVIVLISILLVLFNKKTNQTKLVK